MFEVAEFVQRVHLGRKEMEHAEQTGRLLKQGCRREQENPSCSNCNIPQCAEHLVIRPCQAVRFVDYKERGQGAFCLDHDFRMPHHSKTFRKLFTDMKLMIEFV